MGYGQTVKALTENPAIIEARRCSKCGAQSRSPRDRDSVSVLAIYDALSASHARVREAAEALVAKLDAVDDAVAGAFAFAALHGMAYSGPNYADELSALRAALETP